MLEEGSNDNWETIIDNNEAVPEWADGKFVTNCGGDDSTSFLMFRMCSHFLSEVQPQLELFTKQKLDSFFESNCNIGSSTYSLRQFDIYKEYTSIFERTMERFLEESSKEDIIEALKAANDKADNGQESMGTIMLDYVHSLSCFEEFYAMMKDEAQQSDNKSVPEYPQDKSGYKYSKDEK